MINQIDAELFSSAIANAVTHKTEGRDAEASAWMVEACRLIGCSDIINVRGRELRRDYHAGPRDAVLEAHF